MKEITETLLRCVYEDKGLELFPNDATINITGWRNCDARVNHFDDWISILSVTRKEFEVYPATTRPGVSWLKRLLNPKGTAILAPGQYVDCYQLGYYKRGLALRQVRPVTVYRDINRDDIWDLKPETLDTGMFGLHIHDTKDSASLVNLWSAGCQVFKYHADFFRMVRRYIDDVRPYTYTLVEI